MLLTVIVFIITLLILVIIHELGHFLVAKRFNIKVLEFGFGIPPRAIGKKIGETIYSLNWLPFGGFVRLLGEDETDPKLLDNERSSSVWKKRSFAAAGVYKRIAVVIAGVVMNLILAWVIYWIVLYASNFKFQLPLIIQHQFVGTYQTVEKMVVVGEVSPNSPAAEAGIKQGDRIVAINDRFVKDNGQLIQEINANVGKVVKLTLSDLEQTSFRVVEVTPRENPPEGQGALGVSLGTFEVANLEYKDTWQKVLAGPLHSLNIASYSINILGRLISVSFSQKDITPVSQTVSGPIGITSLVGEILAVEAPLIPYLNFLAALSLNLAIINILPFPGLDGGRLLFLITEAVTRRKVHATVEKYVHTIGLAVLITLILLITASDISKFLI